MNKESGRATLQRHYVLFDSIMQSVRANAGPSGQPNQPRGLRADPNYRVSHFFLIIYVIYCMHGISLLRPDSAAGITVVLAGASHNAGYITAMGHPFTSFLRSDIFLKLADDVSETDAFDSSLRPWPVFAIELRRVAQ